MKRKMLDMFMDEDNDLVRRSSRKVCGTFEREITVKSSDVIKTKSRLKRIGYIIVGSGNAGSNRTKIWFNPAGISL